MEDILQSIDTLMKRDIFTQKRCVSALVCLELKSRSLVKEGDRNIGNIGDRNIGS